MTSFIITPDVPRIIFTVIWMLPLAPGAMSPMFQILSPALGTGIELTKFVVPTGYVSVITTLYAVSVPRFV